MDIEKVKISEVKLNTTNPRTIKDEKFKKLVNSIKEFPQMLEVRPIVVDDDMVVLGGNMRLKACEKAGLKEIPIIRFRDLSEEKKKEFIVKDNLGYGEWDFDLLESEWDKGKLIEWGMDVEDFSTDGGEGDMNYTRKIEAPIYEPKNEKPVLNGLYDDKKYKELVSAIDASGLDEEVKEFLRLSATRHIVFNFQTIADFYAHSDKMTQGLMEDQALVIIDFERAIELGFVKLSEDISNIFREDYEK